MAALQPAAPFRLSPTRFGLLVNRFERNAARVSDRAPNRSHAVPS